MRRLLLFLILIVILFSGINQVKEIWAENGEEIDGGVSSIRQSLFDWYEKATDTSWEVKEELNKRVEQATDKYNAIKSEIESVSDSVVEKKRQLDSTLKELQEAKKALDDLLERNPGLQEEESPSGEEAPEAENTPDAQAGEAS